MGSKIGAIVLETERPHISAAVIRVAQQACLEAGSETAELYAATGVSVAPLFLAKPDRQVAVFVFRAGPRSPGVDGVAEALSASLRAPVMVGMVNDMYQCGGYQLWGDDRSSILVDGDLVVGDTRIRYLDAPRLGLARLLGIDASPNPNRQLDFFEDLTWAAGTGREFRIVENGCALAPVQELDKGFVSLEWNWNSLLMTWPMSEGVMRRQHSRRGSG